MRARYYAGIDPGVSTGIAIWDSEKQDFHTIGTMQIHLAMKLVEEFNNHHYLEGIHVRIEDARQRKWFGNAGREQLQGAGSIKRDCGIWEDYLREIGVSFEMVPPKANKTKLTASAFERLTKYRGRTSEHARDAGMLCFGMKDREVLSKTNKAA